MHKKIPVIDLFAGPGGLGEGFSSILDDNNKRVFDIKLSVEKDKNAHETLKLRSFIRQFPVDDIPPEYYDYVKENDNNKQSEKLEKLKKFIPENGKKRRMKPGISSCLMMKDTPMKRLLKNTKSLIRGLKNYCKTIKTGF